MLIVQKYGGSSLADVRRIQQAAARVASLAMQGCQMVVVVSAQGDTTDEMIQKSTQVNKRGSAREMDAYLSAGEQMSAALFAMAVGALGCPAVSLTGAQAGIQTDETYGNARILSVEAARIHRELAAGNVVVELHMCDGSHFQVHTGMIGMDAFMDHAFRAWLELTGKKQEDCDWYDPDNSCWFPPYEV